MKHFDDYINKLQNEIGSISGVVNTEINQFYPEVAKSLANEQDQKLIDLVMIVSAISTREALRSYHEWLQSN